MICTTVRIISCEFLHSVLRSMWTVRNSLDTQTTSWHKLPHPTEQFVCGGSFLNFVLKLCWTPWERVNTKIQNACLLVLPVGLLFYKHRPTIQPKRKITLSQQTYKLILPSHCCISQLFYSCIQKYQLFTVASFV